MTCGIQLGTKDVIGYYGSSTETFIQSSCIALSKAWYSLGGALWNLCTPGLDVRVHWPLTPPPPPTPSMAVPWRFVLLTLDTVGRSLQFVPEIIGTDGVPQKSIVPLSAWMAPRAWRVDFNALQPCHKLGSEQRTAYLGATVRKWYIVINGNWWFGRSQERPRGLASTARNKNAHSLQIVIGRFVEWLHYRSPVSADPAICVLGRCPPETSIRCVTYQYPSLVFTFPRSYLFTKL